MSEYIEKMCPKCGQQLRFPKHIGGVLMACPSCGKKFSSDFKLAGCRRSPSQTGLLTTIFEMPWKTVRYLGRFF